MMKILIISNQISSIPNSNNNPVIKNLYICLTNQGIEVELLPVDLKKYGFFAYFILVYDLFMIRFSKKNMDYNLFHVHFGGVQSLIAALICPKKTIVSFHGTDLHGGSPMTIRGRLKSKLSVTCSILSARIIPSSTVVSESLKSFLPRSIHRKVYTITTGVDFEKFYPINKDKALSKLSLNERFKYVLFSNIGNSKIKRKDIAEKVIDLLNQSCISFEYKMLEMSGVSPDVVPFYINASDFVLLVSDNEGSPNIVKESLACGVPIYSVDVGDVKDFIKQEPDCLVLDSQNPNEIASQIINKIKENRVGVNVDFWRGVISQSIISKQYIKIYNEI
ncbi:glycosyltransferase [Photobacterium kagoshimensis]|uniref:glycosyltransferase n=1 Tax=Photobacterium kagoshimensis TaxID=2910242 RepID=UPI003D12A1A7